MDIRTGLGFDAHRFAAPDNSRPFFLACLEWEGNGIEGDSDGDVAAHALIDAMMAAAHLGDIGTLFGVGKGARGAGMHGSQMLRECSDLLQSHGFQVINASVSIVANRPKISQRRGEAEQAMTEAIGAPVSITATTTDGMGFTGKGEGVAAMATALISAKRS